MRRLFITVLLSWLGLYLFADKFYEILSFSEGQFMESLVFEPFSWFIALIGLIISLLSFSKMIFKMSFPVLKLSDKRDKLIYGIIIFLALIFYTIPAIITLIFSVVYAFMDRSDYQRRLQRYRGDRN